MIRKINIILFLLITLMGYGLTSFLFYPYALNWDAGNIIENVVKGHTEYDNWMGWLYPAIIDGLYRISGIPHAIGCLQWGIYWLAVSTLFIQLFSPERKSFLPYYLLFTCFPGILFYVDYIANSTLLYCLYLLMCSLSIWTVRQRTWWKLLLLALMCIICISVRRDAMFLVLPTMVLVLYHCYGRLWQMVGIVAFGFVVMKVVESTIESRVPGYNDRINSIELIALYDQMHISRLKQELVIPDSILAEGVTREQMLDSIMSYKTMYNDYTFYASNVDMLRSHDNWHAGVTPDPMIYLENLWYYIRFRLDIVRRYWLDAPDMYNAIRDFEYKSPSYKGWVYHYFGWILYYNLPSILYIMCGLIGLFLSLRYRLHVNVVVPLVLIWTFMLMILMVSATSVTARYIYPTCLCMYQTMIYMIYKSSKLKLVQNEQR